MTLFNLLNVWECSQESTRIHLHPHNRHLPLVLSSQSHVNKEIERLTLMPLFIDLARN